MVVVLLLAMVLLSKRASQAAPSQPIDFSHQRHDEIGIECLYCHPNALRSDFAGIPSRFYLIIGIERSPFHGSQW
jgi:hypothetical protein